MNKNHKNIAWLLLEKSITMGVGLLTSIFIARGLGTNDYGSYSYAISVYALISPLSALGLNAIIVRELTSKNKSIVMSNAFIMRFAGALIGSLFLLFLSANYFITTTYDESYIIVLLSVANLFTAINVVEFWFQSTVESRYTVKVRVFNTIIFGLLKIFLVYKNADLVLFGYVFALEIVSFSILLYLTYCYKVEAISLKEFKRDYATSLLQNSKWLLLSSIAAIIYLKIDQIMLAQYVSKSELGIYAVAARLSEVWYMFPIIIVQTLFPKLLKMRESDKVVYEKELQTLCNYLFGFSLIVIALIFLFSPYIVPLFFGEQYIASVEILKIHIVATVFIFVRALLSKWFIAEGLFKYSLISQALGALTNIVLNLALIPTYGIVGAAYATVISYSVASFWCLLLSKKTRRFAVIISKAYTFPFQFLFKVR